MSGTASPSCERLWAIWWDVRVIRESTSWVGIPASGEDDGGAGGTGAGSLSRGALDMFRKIDAKGGSDIRGKIRFLLRNSSGNAATISFRF